MKILIIGGGGREHALAWKCAQSAGVHEVIVAPGNAGTALEDKVRNVNVAADDIEGLVELATSEQIALTIVGPEQALVAGISNRFSELNLPCFGPRADAAQLEGSKTFAKDFLRRHGIPTADYASFTDVDEALSYVRDKGAPIVIKADGLAAGKGVIVALRIEDAERAIMDMLNQGAFGDAGRKIVIEDYLEGEEASFIVITDGKNVLPLASSQDHKARDDGDKGPNTGGMGAYSPAPVVTPEIERRILKQIIRPTLDGLRNDGIDYLGFLYAGVMIAANGTPKLIEFNCRMGDPETQAIMARLQSDFVEICRAAVAGSLDTVSARWDSRAALGVVMAAGGYPGEYAKGKIIQNLPPSGTDSSKVFHAGTKIEGQNVVSSGGRVLCVVGLGDSVAEAGDTAYSQVKSIDWDGVYYRRDIGHRAIARETA